VVIARALTAIAALAFAGPAHAQTGGIQVAPVVVEMTPERSFGSVRVRNARARSTAFEIDVYAWTQVNGEDVLTPTDALIVAPGVFEMAPGAEQVVRVGAIAPGRERETAFRIILRELPTQSTSGARLGFTLEMSLPVFVTPDGAEASVMASPEAGSMLTVANVGAAHARMISVEGVNTGAVEAPRYLLAGAEAALTLPPRTREVRMRFYQDGQAAERIVQVGDADSRPPVH